MQNITQLLISLTLSLLCTFTLQAQSFVQTIGDTNKITNPLSNACEYEGYYYLPYVVGEINKTYKQAYDEQQPFKQFIQRAGKINNAKTSPDFKVLRISEDGSQSFIYNIDTADYAHKVVDFRLFPKDTHIEMLGVCKNKNDGQKSLFAMHLDKDFNMLYRTIIPLQNPDIEISRIAQILEKDNNRTVFVLQYYDFYSTHPPVVSFAEMDSSYNLLQYVTLDSMLFHRIGLRIVEMDSFYIFSNGLGMYKYTISKDNFAVLDTFNPQPFHHSMFGYSYFKYDDSSFLMPVLYFDTLWPPNPNNEGVIILHWNQDLEIIDSLIIFNPDTSQMQGYESLARRTNDSLYFAGSFNSTMQQVHGYHNNWLMVYNINWHTKEINWVTYYGGNTFYYCFDIFLTSDGGCLVSAGIFDWETATHEKFDMLLMKLDAKGNVTSTMPPPLQEDLMSFTIYPNPSTDIIRIRNDSDMSFSKLQYSIYDMAGRQISSGTCYFSGNEGHINTAALKSGSYHIIIESECGMRMSMPFIKKR